MEGLRGRGGVEQVFLRLTWKDAGWQYLNSPRMSTVLSACHCVSAEHSVHGYLNKVTSRGRRRTRGTDGGSGGGFLGRAVQTTGPQAEAPGGTAQAGGGQGWSRRPERWGPGLVLKTPIDLHRRRRARWGNSVRGNNVGEHRGVETCGRTENSLIFNCFMHTLCSYVMPK